MFTLPISMAIILLSVIAISLVCISYDIYKISAVIDLLGFIALDKLGYNTEDDIKL